MASKIKNASTTKKRFLVLISTLLFLSLTFSFSPNTNAAPAIGSSTTTLYSVADTYVNSSTPDINYGADKNLLLSTSPSLAHAYIMFDLSSLPSGTNVISAKLMVNLAHISGYTGSIGAHFCSNSDWNELSITWNNKPAYVEEATATIYCSMFNWLGYDSWDVTVDVKNALGKGKLTEVLVDTRTSSSSSFTSREGTNKPKLEIEYSINSVFVVHLESIQDTQATNNLGFITIADNASPLPTDVDVVAGSYQIAYGGGYMFRRWETSGGVAVTDANSAITQVTVTGGGTLRAIGDITRLEYSYDHEQGSSESQSAGCIDAVRFTPLFSDKLLTARFYIYNAYSYMPNNFKVHVTDENHNDIITPFEQTPTSTGWFDVDLSSYDITVTVGKDFYIGMEWINDYSPSLGADSTSNLGRSWYWNGTSWQQQTYQDFMIRAVTGRTYDLAISTTTGGSTSPTSGNYSFSAGTSVSIQATADIGYAFDHWEIDGVNTGSTNPYVVTMNANHNVLGIFTNLPPQAVTTTPPTSQTSTPPFSSQLTATPSESATSDNSHLLLPIEAIYIIAAVAVAISIAAIILAAVKRTK